MRTVVFIWSGKLFVKERKMSGPMTVRWGTPDSLTPPLLLMSGALQRRLAMCIETEMHLSGNVYVH